MDKRTETAFVFDGEGNQLQKHVLVWPGRGIYDRFESGWTSRKDGEPQMPSRLYSYAGGTVLLPWEFVDGKWVTGKAIQIDKGGVPADPEMIEGNPKESIRAFGHCGNVILVITWPDFGERTIYIFDQYKRQLSTALYQWSLGSEPPPQFCKGVTGPFLKDFPEGYELVVLKNNKLKTCITVGLAQTMDEDEKIPLLALTL